MDAARAAMTVVCAAAFLSAAYHYRFTFIHGEQRPSFVRTYVCVCVERALAPVALYTNRKSEAITRYGTDKTGLAYLVGSLKHI